MLHWWIKKRPKGHNCFKLPRIQKGVMSLMCVCVCLCSIIAPKHERILVYFFWLKGNFIKCRKAIILEKSVKLFEEYKFVVEITFILVIMTIPFINEK